MSASSASEAAITAWTRLTRAQQTVLSAIEADLKADGFPPRAWCDVLQELSGAPHAALRPVEIEKRLLVAQYNLSRLLDRMQAAGVVERRHCPVDGRGQFIALTAEGRALLNRMLPAYRAAIARHVGTHLGVPQARELAKLLDALIGAQAPQ